MDLTIKQLADRLGVSKTAIRKHMTPEFRGEYTETDRNGVITIDSAGCNLIAETMGKLPEFLETIGNKIPETPETEETITIPRSVLALLEQQLKEKDAQIAELTKAISAQATSVQAAQALHAGTMQQIGDGKRRGLFGFFSKKEK